MKLNRLFIRSVFFLFTALLFVACNKKEDTIVKIIVKDSANQVVSGASVTLLATPSPPPQPPAAPSDNFPMTTSTNSSGEAVFNLNDVYQEGQAGVAVLDVEASANGATGQGIVKAEQEKEVVEVVFIN